MDKINEFIKRYGKRSKSDITEQAIEEYIKKQESEDNAKILAAFRDSFYERQSHYKELGINNFDEYCERIVRNKDEVGRRAQYDKIMNDKIDELKKFVIQRTKKK